MNNLKTQFKLIVYLFLFLNISSTILAKNSDKFSDADDVSNYFSGILSVKDNQYKKSYFYLKSLNNLEDNHYNYSQYYQYSLIAIGKFKDAANYAKKLEGKKIDNFESNLITAVYYLENKDFKNASIYLKRIEKKYQLNSIQKLLSLSLNTWINFKNISDLSSNLVSLDNIPERFKSIKDIQKTFVYCYFNSPKTDAMFEQLTSNPDVDFSRYIFFHLNYLISKKNDKKIKKTFKSSLDRYPRNLVLNQLKLDLEKNIYNNKFDCRDRTEVIAEIFYIISNALAAQNNYILSNFYLNLAKYLNPDFVSYRTLQAENFFLIQEYEESKKIFVKIKKKGSAYSWYASKQIASILIKQEKNKEAANNLKKSFKKILKPTIYEIFDYAEFLKNNEKYEQSIEYYSKVLGLIKKENTLYAQVLDGRGVAYERTNQWDKAEADLLNSLNVSPNDAYVINYLAYSWIEKGINIKRSLQMLRKANRLKPNSGYIIDSLGWALFQLKNYKEAKQYLQQAIKFMASDPVINDHYADALWMNNNKLQARYYWNYVLRLEKVEEKLKKKIEQKLLFGLKS